MLWVFLQEVFLKKQREVDMTLIKRLLATAGVLVAATSFVPRTEATTVVFSDGDFSGWTSTTVADPGGASGSGYLVAFGGNPNAFYRVNQSTPGSTTPYSAIGMFHAPTGPFTYDPSVSGAIQSMDFSADYKWLGVQLSMGQAVGVGVEQNDNIYLAFTANTQSPLGWTPSGTKTLTLANFGLVDAKKSVSGTWTIGRDLSQPPDFSAGGAPLEFGLFTANSAASQQYVGYDNYRLEIKPIPEPSTLILLTVCGLALPACAWRKRR